eukprot:3559513-Rhodomonas_salina.1
MFAMPEHTHRKLLDVVQVIDRCRQFPASRALVHRSSHLDGLLTDLIDSMVAMPSYAIHISEGADGSITAESEEITLDFGCHLSYSTRTTLELKVVNKTNKQIDFEFSGRAAQGRGASEVDVQNGSVYAHTTRTMEISLSPNDAWESGLAPMSQYEENCNLKLIWDENESLICGLKLRALVQEPRVNVLGLTHLDGKSVGCAVKTCDYGVDFGVVAVRPEAVRRDVGNTVDENSVRSFKIKNCTECDMLVKVQSFSESQDASFYLVKKTNAA